MEPISTRTSNVPLNHLLVPFFFVIASIMCGMFTNSFIDDAKHGFRTVDLYEADRRYNDARRDLDMQTQLHRAEQELKDMKELERAVNQLERDTR